MTRETQLELFYDIKDLIEPNSRDMSCVLFDDIYWMEFTIKDDHIGEDVLYYIRANLKHCVFRISFLNTDVVETVKDYIEFYVDTKEFFVRDTKLIVPVTIESVLDILNMNLLHDPCKIEMMSVEQYV